MRLISTRALLDSFHPTGGMTMSEGSEQEDIGGPLCETCGELLTFIRATPKVGALPALETFSCIKCGDVKAIEVNERPARTPESGHSRAALRGIDGACASGQRWRHVAHQEPSQARLRNAGSAVKERTARSATTRTA